MLIQTPYYRYNGLEGLTQWRDTEKFREAALRWLKDGYYCAHTSGTYAYKEFWDQEEDRMLNGMTADGQTISGLHYIYLNYCPIYKKKEKIFTLPDFWDLDADWFKQIDTAEQLGKYIVALKARQRGFSLKDMVPFLRNLHFRRKSINYLASYLETHANKSWRFLTDYLNHLNKFTDFYKNRRPDTSEHIRMAVETYEAGKKVENGKLSELYKVILKDNPSKGVGGNCNLFVYEEAGIVPGDQLLQTLEYVKPATMEGNEVTGLIILYGSVGDLDKCQSLKEIFYKPGVNGFLEFDNIWEDETIGSNKCGYFVPQYICMNPFMDKYGNSNIGAALQSIQDERVRKKKLSTKQFTTYITQNPIKPSEAFLARTKSKMPIQLLQKQLARVETSSDLSSYGYAVELHNDKGVIKEKILYDIRTPFIEYPVDIGNQVGAEGNIWIYEPPIKGAQGLYIASIDDVAQLDNAATSDSLFSCYVYKKDTGILAPEDKDKERFKKQVVASYIGRKEPIMDMYNNTALLLEYYNNCKAFPENINTGLISHFMNVLNKDYLLQSEMQEIKGINPTGTSTRRYGFHPTKEVIFHIEDLIVKYCLEKMGYNYNEDGTIESEIQGVERILDVGLLKELIEYDGERNADRVRTFGACLLYEEATFSRKVSVQENIKSPMSQAAQLAGKLLDKYKNFNTTNKKQYQVLNQLV